MANLTLEHTVQFVDNSLDILLKKLDQSNVGRLIGDLNPTTRTLLSGAAVAILIKLCFGERKKRRKYITELDKVGKRVSLGQNTLTEDVPAYDIIIVGGGETRMWSCSLVCIKNMLCRYIWLCSCSSSIRRP